MIRFTRLVTVLFLGLSLVPVGGFLGLSSIGAQQALACKGKKNCAHHHGKKDKDCNCEKKNKHCKKCHSKKDGAESTDAAASSSTESSGTTQTTTSSTTN